MPKDKDLKRLARERMAKTGESYTTARAQLLAKRSHAGERLSEPELAELAAISTAALTKATGHDWGWWLEHLNAANCQKKEHREITRYVAQAFDISGWWTQSVVVGFERIVGLREIGQRREGTYDASKSKTLAVPVDVLYTAFDDPEMRKRWMPDIDWQVRTSTAPRSIRLSWSDDCPVALWFTAKGDSKSLVQIQHSKLASKEDVQRIKAEWSQRLDALRVFLTG